LFRVLPRFLFYSSCLLSSPRRETRRQWRAETRQWRTLADESQQNSFGEKEKKMNKRRARQSEPVYNF
jgi:hypothetical protein